MPNRALIPCAAPGCPLLVQAGRYARCKIHSQAYRANTLNAAEAARHSARFLSMRKAFLMRQPVCNICKREPSMVLDHIRPHRGDSYLFWSQTNWQGLCTTCHNRKTASEVLP